MLPTRLNLLPPEKQSYLQRMVFVQFIKSTLETLLFLLCIGGIGLLGGQWVLQNYFNDLTESTIAVAHSQNDNSIKIKEVNYTVRTTRAIQSKYSLWTPVLIEIGNSIPNDVVISSMSINLKKKNFTFSGRAKTRRDLLALQEQLERLPEIDSIDIPLSQLTKPEDISFSISANVK